MNAINDILLSLGINDLLRDVYTTLGWQFLAPPTFDKQPNYSKINLKTSANMFLALYKFVINN